ncbi:MAG: sulfurtransferase TusA family protein [Planctomycetes bacterium]|nr:sulfurtransferase TusA family protein [Planctomycetota bacterium]
MARAAGEPPRSPDSAERHAATDALAAAAAAPTAATATPRAAHCYDAGDLGCGDLVLELRLRLRELAPGSLLEVIARDPGAPADLPAWCGLTGHTLLEAAPPRYLIRRRPD